MPPESSAGPQPISMLRSRPMSLARSLRVFMKFVSQRHGAMAMSRIQSGSIMNLVRVRVRVRVRARVRARVRVRVRMSPQ